MQTLAWTHNSVFIIVYFVYCIVYFWMYIVYSVLCIWVSGTAQTLAWTQQISARCKSSSDNEVIDAEETVAKIHYWGRQMQMHLFENCCTQCFKSEIVTLFINKAPPSKLQIVLAYMMRCPTCSVWFEGDICFKENWEKCFFLTYSFRDQYCIAEA